jgi:HlyD family secretion protein
VVLARNVERGTVAQPGRALLVLAPNGETQVVAQIDERNLPLLAVGQEALVSADAYPDRRFAARVLSIHPAVDPLRGSIEVKLVVPQPPAYLLQDMTVSVDIRAATRSAVLAMPAEALRPGDWVYAVRDGRAVRQPVRVGPRGRGLVEVVDGLKEGERVLPAAGLAVREGQSVRVRETPRRAA